MRLNVYRRLVLKAIDAADGSSLEELRRQIAKIEFKPRKDLIRLRKRRIT